MADVKITQPSDKSNQTDVLKKVAEDVMEVEMQMPAGGNQIINWEKNRIETVGLYTNLTPATRKHTAAFRPKTVQIEGKGSYTKQEPVQYVEEIENSRFPCGTYSLNVGNKYTVDVGSGGVAIKTAGNMKLNSDGRSVISATDEIYMSSPGNINLASSDNISIVGNSLKLQGSNQVYIDCNLGVKSNLLVNGGAFVDGEVFLNHISCPAEIQYTGGGIGSYGQFMVNAGANGDIKGGGGSAVIAWADVSYIKTLLETPISDSRGDTHKYSWVGPDKVPVLVLASGGTDLNSTAGNGGVQANPPYSVFVYPHEHPFNNIPLTFTTSNEKTRNMASKMNSGGAINASPISHGYKTPV